MCWSRQSKLQAFDLHIPSRLPCRASLFMAPVLHSIFSHDGGRAGHYLQKIFQRAHEQIAGVNAIARAKANDLSSRRYVRSCRLNWRRLRPAPLQPSRCPIRLKPRHRRLDRLAQRRELERWVLAH